MSSVFALPLPSHQQPAAGTYIRHTTKKRKRNLDQDQDTIPEDTKDSQTSEYTAVITPQERTQRRIAGQPIDHKPPKWPFPHSKNTPASDRYSIRRSSLGSRQHEIDERSLPPRGPTLHLQHMGAMTAALHKFLMAKDFHRAGRALGLLLRDQIGGHDIDIRNEGRWGIGAEVLLRRGTRSEQETLDSDTVLSSPNSGSTVAGAAPFYTLTGFLEAKRYYEALILQYPFHKRAATAVNALDFYTAMFGLWIFVAHEESKAANTAEEEITPQEPGSPFSASSRAHSAKSRELERAREIAGRMDSAMSTFPYSDDLELIRLRAMVALWVADLIDSCSDHQHHAGALDSDCEPVEILTADITNMRLNGREMSDRHVSRAESARSRQTAHELLEKIQRQSSNVE